MLRKSKLKEIPYNEIDYEMRELIKHINRIDGIETIGCCCGHGVDRAWINLVADSIEDVNKFMYKYFYCNDGWEVSLRITDADIDNQHWGRLNFILHTTEVIEPSAVLLAISDITKKFKLKWQEETIKKLMEKVSDDVKQTIKIETC